MAKVKERKPDMKGWPLINKALYTYINLTRFPELPEKPAVGKNYEYHPEGAVCANGEPYHGCLRLGKENKLMIAFSGGGVSFDEYTAARPNTVGNSGQTFYSQEVFFADIVMKLGTYGRSRQNPFRDWSILFVPYATGDFHCGTNDFPYTDLNGKPAILHHHGYKNYRALLSKIKELVPNPEQIIVTGFSAGAFATSLLTDDVCGEFPDCGDVTAIVDSAIMRREWRSVAENVWKAPKEISDRLTGDEIVTDSLLALHEKRPEVKIMYCCSKRDAALTQFVGYLQENGNWKPTARTGDIFQRDLKELTETLSERIPNLAVFIFDTPDKSSGDANLTVHCICGSGAAFTTKADGVKCVDWMVSGVNGKPLKLGLGNL